MGLSFVAPLAGRDYAVALGEQVVIISIHAPLAGRDPSAVPERVRRQTFQSTRPLRGATENDNEEDEDDMVFQSTRPLRGATIAA